jgi:N-acetylneuraminic acid mutarotase
MAEPTWTLLSSTMEIGRCGHAAVVLGDAVVVVGGYKMCNQKSGEAYHLLGKLGWERFKEMLKARAYHVVVQHRGCLFVVGGVDVFGRALKRGEM